MAAPACSIRERDVIVSPIQYSPNFAGAFCSYFPLARVCAFLIEASRSVLLASSSVGDVAVTRRGAHGGGGGRARGGSLAGESSDAGRGDRDSVFGIEEMRGELAGEGWVARHLLSNAQDDLLVGVELIERGGIERPAWFARFLWILAGGRSCGVDWSGHGVGVPLGVKEALRGWGLGLFPQ